jgi:hypothetical protein
MRTDLRPTSPAYVVAHCRLGIPSFARFADMPGWIVWFRHAAVHP